MTAPATLRAEFHAWHTAWREIEAFVGRIEELRDRDLPEARRHYALLDVASVLERNRPRRGEMALALPTVASAGGSSREIASHTLSLEAIAERLPGPEDAEATVAPLTTDGSGVVQPYCVSFLESRTLFEAFAADGDAAPFIVPSYDFGILRTATAPLRIDAPLGHLSDQARAASVQLGFGGSDRPWTALREYRRSHSPLLSQLAATDDPATRMTILRGHGGGWIEPSSEDLATLRQQLARQIGERDPDWRQPLAKLTETLRLAVAGCEADRESLDRARQDLERSGTGPAPPHLSGAIRAFEDWTSRYREALDLLDCDPDELTAPALDRAITRIERLDDLDTGHLVPLDMETARDLDQTIEARVAHPDGTLRLLRTLEGSARDRWDILSRWFANRGPARLAPQFAGFVGPFLDDLAALLAGRETSFPLRGSTVARDTVSLSTTLSLAVSPTDAGNLSRIRAGQVAVVGGDRPTLAVVLGLEPAVPGGPRLLTAPLVVSGATGPDLPGTPSLVRAGSSVTAGPISLSPAELEVGSCERREADGVAQTAVGLASRLRLLLGDSDFASRGITVPASNAEPLDLPVDVPVSLRATSLTVQQIPATFRSEDPDHPGQRIARPDELMLLRGKDADGIWRQCVVEVAGLLGGTPGSPPSANDTPPCVDPAPDGLTIVLKGHPPGVELVEDVRLHRRFRGFGVASLAAGELLPATVDPDERTRAPVDEDGAPIDRSPELDAARKLLGRWLGEIR